jgi:hypothetical protein
LFIAKEWFFFPNCQGHLAINFQKLVEEVLTIEKNQSKYHWLSCICVKQKKLLRHELLKMGSDIQE